MKPAGAQRRISEHFSSARFVPDHFYVPWFLDLTTESLRANHFLSRAAHRSRRPFLRPELPSRRPNCHGLRQLRPGEGVPSTGRTPAREQLLQTVPIPPGKGRWRSRGPKAAKPRVFHRVQQKQPPPPSVCPSPSTSSLRT